MQLWPSGAPEVGAKLDLERQLAHLAAMSLARRDLNLIGAALAAAAKAAIERWQRLFTLRGRKGDNLGLPPPHWPPSFLLSPLLPLLYAWPLVFGLQKSSKGHERLAIAMAEAIRGRKRAQYARRSFACHCCWQWMSSELLSGPASKTRANLPAKVAGEQTNAPLPRLLHSRRVSADRCDDEQTENVFRLSCYSLASAQRR